MKNENFVSDIIDLYYGEANLSLKAIAAKHAVSFELCQTELQNIVLVSKSFQSLPQSQASQMTLNKIAAHARERAQNVQSVPFWQSFFRPAYTMALLLFVGFATYQIWTVNTAQNPAIAKVPVQPQPTFVAINNHHNVSPLQQRLFNTPLDNSLFSSQKRMLRGDKYINPLVKDVSFGSSNEASFVDDELERKMMGSNLNSQDLQTLFFRARKLEKQGYYEEALHDYNYIVKNHADFEYKRALPLAIVRCYENLGQKDKALSVLEGYEITYGQTPDTQLWKDLLKSETL